MMFEKPAIESGVEYDDDVKAKMWLEYMVGYYSPLLWFSYFYRRMLINLFDNSD